MKSLGGEGRQVKKKVITAEEGLRYAMSLPVATTVSGIDSMRVLRQNVRIATNFKPMSAEQMERLRHRLAPVAADGRFELYKTSALHDGDEGRSQHGFPSPEAMAG
jgi:hypothetical protein